MNRKKAIKYWTPWPLIYSDFVEATYSQISCIWIQINVRMRVPDSWCAWHHVCINFLHCNSLLSLNKGHCCHGNYHGEFISLGLVWSVTIWILTWIKHWLHAPSGWGSGQSPMTEIPPPLFFLFHPPLVRRRVPGKFLRALQLTVTYIFFASV